MITFRPYRSDDYDACVALFDSNVPKFFALHERVEFMEFLQALPCPYFMLIDEAGAVLACGGIGEWNGVGGLAWGMVAREQHKHGLGLRLLQERLAWFRVNYPHVHEVRMDTSQYSVGFFERQGFRAQKIVMHGFAPNLHQYYLSLHW